ncbi:hypothetical protein Tco_1146414 [Tanacetum coccineum]
MRRVNTFVPIESEVDSAVPELAAGSLKRDVEEELYQESSKRQKTGESSELAKEPRDKEADELSQEELQQMMIILFEPDADDELWKLQKHIHDLTWKLYDSCGVHHMPTEKEIDIYMLVEKEHPLSRGILTLMLKDQEDDVFGKILSENKVQFKKLNDLEERKIVEIDQDPGISLVQHDVEIQGRYEHDMEFEIDFNAAKKVSTTEKDEIYTEGTRKYWNIIRVRNHTKLHHFFVDMLKAFDKDDIVMLWSLVKEKFNSTELVDDKEREIWVGGNMFTKRNIDINMLVEKEYPLSRGTLTLMLVAKLLVERDNELSRELLMKIFMQVERPRR